MDPSLKLVDIRAQFATRAGDSTARRLETATTLESELLTRATLGRSVEWPTVLGYAL